MKRLLFCAAVALAVSLVLAPAALASVGAHHSDVNARPLGLASHARTVAPVGDTGPYSISGNVLDFGGAGVQGAEVDWGYWTTAGDYTYGGDYYPTDTSGYFSFTGIPGGHTFNGLPSDELDVYYPTGAGLNTLFDWALDFATTSAYPMQPGHVSMTLANVPADATVEVRAGNDDEGYARGDVTLASNAGTACSLAATDVNDLTAYGYYVDHSGALYDMVWAADEWLGTPMPVAAGGTGANTVALDWDNAQGAWLAGPLCRHSGAPGRALTMVIADWPAGETASFEGWYGTSLDTFYSGYSGMTVTSTDPTAAYTKSLKVYSKAPVGVYEIDTYRSDTPSLLDMWDLYQVTSFKASTGSIRVGHAVRLSGKVPGSGTATLYSVTKKVTSQPSALSAKGWHKVGSVKIKSGKFTTAYLHPKRTTWYVIKYKGSAFWAFTQIVKVTVR